jgi:hypothetical protein
VLPAALVHQVQDGLRALVIFLKQLKI